MLHLKNKWEYVMDGNNLIRGIYFTVNHSCFNRDAGGISHLVPNEKKAKLKHFFMHPNSPTVESFFS